MSSERKRPQLAMLRPTLDNVPPLAPLVGALPAGYALRTYRPGDEGAWAELMNTGDMGVWDVERVRAELTGRPEPQFDPDGLFIVTAGAEGAAGAEGEVVGSACAWLADPEERETGVLHMVCVLPAYRGRRLSEVVCLAVLHRFRDRGIRRVRLSTDDFRPGAIKVYLGLGFRPLIRDASHPERWDDVLRELNWTAPVERIQA